MNLKREPATIADGVSQTFSAASCALTTMRTSDDSQFLQGAVLVGRKDDGAIDVLARAARRRHDDVFR